MTTDALALVDDLAGRTWSHHPRVLVVVAHPDDDILGCGGLIAGLRDVRVVFATDGAPRNGSDAARHGFADRGGYAAARWREALAALAMAGLSGDRVSTLAVPDQEGPWRLAALVRDLAAVVASADMVLTHAFEGGHGDHDATAFAVHAALRLTPPAQRPTLIEMPFYHAGREGWVRQRFLPHPQAGPERVLTLGPERQALKARMLAAHRSQGDTLQSFAIEVERFRRAPPHAFTRQPHAGDLLYERHGWNLDWASWVANTRQAREALGLWD